MKILVGIDVAKSKHDVYAVNQETGEIIVSSMKIKNSLSGFNRLWDKIKTFIPSDVLIGMEETGHYHQNLACFFHGKGFEIGLLNPLATNRLRQTTLRKTKTDKVDCKVIVTAMGLGMHYAFKAPEPAFDDMKSLARHRFYLVGEQSKLKQKLHKAIDVAFPEYHGFFSKIHTKTSYALLKSFSTAEEILRGASETVQTVLDTYQRRYSAYKLQGLAETSIGSHSLSVSFEVKSLIRLIESLEEQIKTTENALEELLLASQKTILSIPGVSVVLGSMILGEIGDISRFGSPKKLLAFAGLDPTVYQSGQYLAPQSRQSKRGSKYLRYALLKVASIIVNHDPTFKVYYTSKKSQGKHHNVILGHVAKKLVSVLFKLLTENIEFESKN